MEDIRRPKTTNLKLTKPKVFFPHGEDREPVVEIRRPKICGKCCAENRKEVRR